MARASYTLELMLGYNVWADATAGWRSADPLVIERGIAPGESAAAAGRMTLTLHSPDGRYTPGHPGALAGFGPGTRVRLLAADGAGEWPLFTGRVASVTPGCAAGGAADAVRVTCEDAIAALERVPVGAFPLLVDAAPGEVAARLIERALVPVGRLAFWRLGHPQAARLGEGTALGDAGAGLRLDTGESVFPWVGDGWPPGRSTSAALRDVCASEGGQFYVAADGTPTFRGRHHRPRHTDADAAPGLALAALDAPAALGHTANRVSVTAHPRAVGAAGSVLWAADADLHLLPGEVREIACRYRDPTGAAAAAGALSVTPPQPGTDYTAQDEQGADRTAALSVTLAAGGAGAAITLRSAWVGPLTVRGLRLRGTPLYAYHPVTTVREDTAAVLDAGLLPLALDLPLQADPAVAADRAGALLAGRATPRPWPVLTVEATASADALRLALSLDVGARLHVNAPALGIDAAACFVERIRHEIARGGASHRVTWRTSPADLTGWWALGETPHAALGSGAVLGY